MFNPALYHYDPEILKAQRRTTEASREPELDFGEGFRSKQDLSTDEGRQAWATSGLSGLLLSKLYSEESQNEWFIQRHAVDYGLNELESQIQAMRAEAELRTLTKQEKNRLDELEYNKEGVLSGLNAVAEQVDGDLDAKLYADGMSFNDKWGIGSDEETGLGQFFGYLKDHPGYMAGAITGELVKDLPLTVLSFLGLTKVDSVRKIVSTIERRLARIKPKSLRFTTTLGAGVGTGATLGGLYEGVYSAADQGTVKGEDVWLGAKFGATFGVIGGAVLASKGSNIRRGDTIIDAEMAEAEVGTMTNAMKEVAKGQRDNAKSILNSSSDTKLDQSRITQQAKDTNILTDYNQKIKPLGKDDKGIIKTELDDDDNIVTYINEIRLEAERKALLKEVEDMFSKGPEYRGIFDTKSPNTIKEMTLRDWANLRNKEAYKALALAHSKARGKLMLDARRRGEPLPDDWEADINIIVQRELDAFDAKFKKQIEQARKEAKAEDDAAQLESPEGREALDIEAKAQERKDLETELKRLGNIKNRTPEETAKLDELTARAKEIDLQEGIPAKELGPTGKWIEGNPYKAAGLGAILGATLLPGETSDNLASAVLGAGLALVGPKAYRKIAHREFNAAALRAKAAIAKGNEVSANDMKILEASMQEVTEDMHKLFKGKTEGETQSIGMLLINYLETGNEKGLSPEQLKVAKRTRAILNLIGEAAVDAGIIKKASHMAEGKMIKGEMGAFLHNYFPHLFDKKMTDEDIAALVKEWGKSTTKQSLSRTLEGTVALINERYPDKKIVISPTKALEIYTQAMTRAIHGKNMINSLAKIDLSMGKGTYLPAIMTEKAFQLLKKRGKLTDQDLLHYETFDHSSLDGYRVHTSVKGLVDNHFDVLRKGTLSELMQGVLDVNNGIKRIFVFGSMFHGQALLTSLVYSLGVKGVYQGFKKPGMSSLSDGTFWSQLQLGTDTFRDLAKRALEDGLQIISIKKQTLVDPGRDQVNALLDKGGQLGVIARKGFDAIDYATWEWMHDRFKLATYLTKKEQAKKNLIAKGMDPKEADAIAGRQAADFANDAYGSLNWEKFITKLYEYNLKNPTKLRGKIAGVAAEMLPIKNRKWANLFLFAPDWTISNIRIVGRMFTTTYKYSEGFLKAFHQGKAGAWKSKQGRELLESWKMYTSYSARAGLVNSSLWWLTMQLFSDDEPTMEGLADFWYGPNSHKVKLGDGHSVVISKQIAEPIHWVQHPMHTLSNKMSVVPKTAAELFLNKEWFSLKKDIPTGPSLIDSDGNYHHARWLLGKVTPIVIKPLFSPDEDLSFLDRVSMVTTGFGGFPQYRIKQD